MDDHTVFISYSSKQKKIANDVQRYLESNGVKCWMDKKIHGGQIFSEELAKAIKVCDIMVVVCSKSACSSKWVLREVGFASNNDKHIVPFFIEEVILPECFSMIFANVQVINAYPNYEERFPDLLNSIYVLEGNQNKKDVDENCNIEFQCEEKRKKDSKRVRKLLWFLACLVAVLCVHFVIVGISKGQKTPDLRCPEVHADVSREKIDICINEKIGYTLKLVEGQAHGINAGGKVIDSFYIGETEVTNLLWHTVMGESVEKSDYHYPISNVAYKEIEEVFLPKLCELTEMSFRLPTEDEWEYAAKGGNHSKGYIYSGSNTIDEVAWYRENSVFLQGNDEKNSAKKVKLQKPNEIGLYDMSGNVWEWCEDLWPESESVKNHHVIRGGGWNANPQDCEVSCRANNNRHARSYSRQPGNDVGFRIVLPK